LYSSQARVEDVMISSNGGEYEYGGGIWICHGDGMVTVAGSVIKDNLARQGGGLCLCSSEGLVTLDGNVISGNSAEEGGGLYFDGNVTLINDAIINNEANNTD